VDHESHATAAGCNGLSTIVVAAALGPPAEHARDRCWASATQAALPQLTAAS